MSPVNWVTMKQSFQKPKINILKYLCTNSVYITVDLEFYSTKLSFECDTR